MRAAPLIFCCCTLLLTACVHGQDIFTPMTGYQSDDHGQQALLSQIAALDGQIAAQDSMIASANARAAAYTASSDDSLIASALAERSSAEMTRASLLSQKQSLQARLREAQ